MKDLFQIPLTQLLRFACFAGLISLFDVTVSRIFPQTIPFPQSPLIAVFPPHLFRALITGYLVLAVTLGKNKSYVWPYALAYIVPLITWYSANLGNYWTVIWMVFGIIPLFEMVSGEDKENPTPEEEKELNSRISFRLITMVWVPIQVVFMIWGAWAVSTWNLSIIEFILLSISIGFNTGILGINISHELIHKNNDFELFLGKFLLVCVCYGHWYIEHLWGHHKQVSTPYDSATSKLGESFYSFWPRSVYGSFLSAWHIETERLKKKNSSFWENQVLWLNGCSLSIAFVLGLVWGYKAVIMFFVQSVVAFTLLEMVNYIEHYGLERKSTGKGTYEPVNPTHSWNANARVTNYFLFKLQRHSDHHAYASRRYQILRSFDTAPQMPTGYGGMLLLSLIPPLWFHILDPRVKNIQLNLID